MEILYGTTNKALDSVINTLSRAFLYFIFPIFQVFLTTFLWFSHLI